MGCIAAGSEGGAVRNNTRLCCLCAGTDSRVESIECCCCLTPPPVVHHRRLMIADDSLFAHTSCVCVCVLDCRLVHFHLDLVAHGMDPPPWSPCMSRCVDGSWSCGAAVAHTHVDMTHTNRSCRTDSWFYLQPLPKPLIRMLNA